MPVRSKTYLRELNGWEVLEKWAMPFRDSAGDRDQLSSSWDCGVTVEKKMLCHCGFANLHSSGFFFFLISRCLLLYHATSRSSNSHFNKGVEIQ